MGIYYNPRPVNAGLIFAYDMQNTKKSFVGRPTTNVVADPYPLSNWTLSNFSGSSATLTYEFENNIPHLKITNVTLGTGNPDYPRIVANSNFLSNIIDGFSISFEAKGTPGEVIKLAIYSSGSTKITASAVLSDQWTKYTFNNQSTGFTLDKPYIRFDSNITNSVRYIRKIQVEQNSFATPFVAGTRSATQAILDFTNNRTITASDLTYNNDNTFAFDGTNDVILTDFPAQTLQTSTLEAVVYDTKNNGAYRSIIQINTNTDDALYINPSNNLMFWPATASSLQVPANQWNYVCAAYNGSSILYCVNGEFQEIAGASLDFTNYQFLRIGAHSTGDGERFKGQIPIARVYNRALTRSEMLQNYSAFRGRFGI